MVGSIDLNFVLDTLREAPPTDQKAPPLKQRLFDYLVSIVGTDSAEAVNDPRGGPAIDAATSLKYNNLHVPYRGGDFQAAHMTPDGQPCSFMWMLPYIEDALTDASSQAALNQLRAKAQGKGGQNAQRWAQPYDFGVTIDG